MSCWIDSNPEGSMEYLTAGRRQEREDTSLVTSQRLLFDEAGLTNATVVDDAIRFVSEKSKDKDKEDQVKSSSSSSSSDNSSNEDDNKESKEPDYDDDEKLDSRSAKLLYPQVAIQKFC
jgi:hypothetical protein